MKTAIATTSTALRINHRAQTIELTKAFAKDAERFGSKSYKELNEARHEFPTYDIAILRQKAKDSHKGLGLDFMKKYIENNDKDGKVKEVFEKCTTTKKRKTRSRRWNRFLGPSRLVLCSVPRNQRQKSSCRKRECCFY